MRTAVITDIHGNFRAFQAVLEDIDQQDVDAIISLGDNVGYGPEPDEVVQLLIRKNIPSVQGNHELALGDSAYYKQLNEPTRLSLDITRSQLSQTSLDWLLSLPSLVIRGDCRFVHGCPPDSITTYLLNPTEDRLTRIFSTYDESLCFAGHTHLLNHFILHGDGHLDRAKLSPAATRLEVDCRSIIIPGSVGQPRDNLSNKAKYALWDQDSAHVQIREVAYDVDTTCRLILERGFPETNARRLKW